MLESVSSNASYVWTLIGIALIILELFAPGSFFVWIGLSSLITAGFTALFSLESNAQLAVFAILTISFVFIGKRILARLKANKTVDDNDVSDRLTYLVGKVVVLEKEMQNGSGQARIADSIWNVYSNDDELSLPAGSKVKIIATKQGKLFIELASQ